ncbi:hemagglutinin, partial [Fusobacterium periodonticum 1_1_41FAA]
GKVKYDTVTQGITVTDGKATVPATDGLTTAKDIANVVNNLGWKANAGGNVDGTSTSTLVKSGDEVVFKAGDNITVKQDLSAGKQEYTYKLNKQLKDLTSAEFKTAAGDKTVINGDGLTINPVTPATAPISVTKDGISAGNKVIKNVAPGVNPTDAVNVSQLTKLGTNTIQLGGDNSTVTATQQLDKTGGIKFDIVGANGITTEAKNGTVTVKVDSATIGSNSKLKYTANGATPKQEVTLADGLNFQDGKFTKASVDTAGKVKYDTVTQGITVTDGKATVPATDGLTTAKDIANALNNLGWKANAG